MGLMGQKFKDCMGFYNEGEFYKGNLHSHTTNSDGKFTPQQAVQAFRKKGYSFLCLSDHDVYTDDRKKLQKEDFLLLPGMEASFVLVEEDCKKVHHMNVILGTLEMQKKANRPPFLHNQKVGPFVFYDTWSQKEVNQKIKEWKEMGMMVTYNHPIWSRITPEELFELSGFDILEIYNYNTQLESATGYDVTYWDQLLRRGKKVLAMASDDNHNNMEIEDAFGGFLMVKAKKLTHDAIIEAILKGSYYSSSGPKIYDWGVKEDTVYIQCEAAESITFIADGYVGAGRSFYAKEKKALNHATYCLTGKENYVRIECKDKFGKTAWTNPIFLKKELV